MRRFTLSGVVGAVIVLANSGLEAQGPDLCGRPRETPEAIYDRLTKAEKLKESFRDKSYVAINDAAAGVVWTFTVPGHPAHPSVVCRRPVETGGELRLEMHVQCNAAEAECERLVKAFQELNTRMLQDARRQQKK